MNLWNRKDDDPINQAGSHVRSRMVYRDGQWVEVELERAQERPTQPTRQDIIAAYAAAAGGIGEEPDEITLGPNAQAAFAADTWDGPKNIEKHNVGPWEVVSLADYVRMSRN